ncbi:flagellar hook-associated protein FlgL [Pluralibacter gergoviae]|uniref:flagellar hook-associated protein FlgL n=1 Tax=Pluralibacter gergoviae TaxID=61647 RepID=UPI00155EEC7F|nr:flagellar hook-associated protein FlgL [Pluralibacter gergoviae]
MRLTSYYMFQNNIDSLSNAMKAKNDVGTCLSAQRSLLRPSDNPAGASQAIAYQNTLSTMSEYDTAQGYAKDALELEDNTLSSIGNLLTKNLSEKIVQGGNQALSDADRQALATELQGIRDNLLDLANTKNSNGRYIFSGYKTGTAPFNKDGSYAGGDTPMTQKVADSTEMQVGHTGSDVFMSGSSDDLFKALDNAIAALNKPVSSDADREALKSVLDQSNVSIKKGIDNLGRVQAEVGTTLQHIDGLSMSSATDRINVESRLQQTVGSDPDTITTMITRYQMADFALESSAKVFQSMQNLNIFNYLK